MSAEPLGRGMGLSCVEIHYCILYAGVNNGHWNPDFFEQAPEHGMGLG
jgi:hypothetical protein